MKPFVVFDTNVLVSALVVTPSEFLRIIGVI